MNNEPKRCPETARTLHGNYTVCDEPVPPRVILRSVGNNPGATFGDVSNIEGATVFCRCAAGHWVPTTRPAADCPVQWDRERHEAFCEPV